MINEQSESFFQNEMTAANSHDLSTVDSCINCVRSLEAAFNRLYNEAAKELKRLPNKDHVNATQTTLEYIGTERFQKLYQNKLEDPVRIICNLIENGDFHITLQSNHERTPNRQKDAILLNNLKSNGNKQFLAILEMNYQIRCNTVHGQKDRAPRQKELLIPLITILHAIIYELHEKLCEGEK